MFLLWAILSGSLFRQEFALFNQYEEEKQKNSCLVRESYVYELFIYKFAMCLKFIKQSLTIKKH